MQKPKDYKYCEVGVDRYIELDGVPLDLTEVHKIIKDQNLSACALANALMTLADMFNDEIPEDLCQQINMSLLLAAKVFTVEADDDVTH